ncbi:tRNA (adenine(22)-N(1))-methyltransferase [Veillonella agrestimuris]|uniref:tRNA (adenine(22)-N(1))-methyltransferase n=1 Tax=Veillonella agrestimuris TaxID=2941340 RepID=UPI00203E2198|nr:class I SAM-dependent methyltransferase [Veillonella agrestimuris]
MKARTMTRRLEAVFSIVPRAAAIADIGTDHGYLAAELINRGKAKHVIAGDVHKGPLESAKSYIKNLGLEHCIDCRLGDGLQVTERGELQGAICCGMGGFLMRDIVKAGPERLEFYVLQPQNGQAELRQYMVEEGYAIIKEILVKDMGKLYTAFLAVREDVLFIYDDNYQINDTNHIYRELRKDSILWSVGALLAEEKPPLWEEYINHLIYQRQCVLDGMTEALQDTDKYKVLSAEIKELTTYI